MRADLGFMTVCPRYCCLRLKEADRCCPVPTRNSQGVRPALQRPIYLEMAEPARLSGTSALDAITSRSPRLRDASILNVNDLSGKANIPSIPSSGESLSKEA